MILDLSQQKQVEKFKNYSTHLLQGLKRVDIKELKDTRTSRQNAALHLYFTMISQEKGQQLSLRYSPDIVKDYFWRPIQETLFDIKSTTKINSNQINDIVDVISKFFAEKGVHLLFPSMESLTEKSN
jgi:hypothetical protein